MLYVNSSQVMRTYVTAATLLASIDWPKGQSLRHFSLWLLPSDTGGDTYATLCNSPRYSHRYGPWIQINWHELWAYSPLLIRRICTSISSRFSWK